MSPTGTETVLYSFKGPPDGASPYGGVVFDAQGNLYGTTYVGGAGNCYLGCGTVFVLAPTGMETVLHSFTSADGDQPMSGLVLDPQGNLYGTTSIGGAYGLGTAYKVTPTGALTTLYSFTGGADGLTPYGNMIFDAEGSLYGTTHGGGAYNYGTVFKLTP